MRTIHLILFYNLFFFLVVPGWAAATPFCYSVAGAAISWPVPVCLLGLKKSQKL